MKPQPELEELKEQIEPFLLEHPRPLLTEPGHDVIDLSVSSYSLSMQHDKLLWHIWNERANVVRQVTGIQKQRPGRIELRYQRFGKGPAGTLLLADSRARPDQIDRRSRRAAYMRALRRWLSQLFPEWKIDELTTEPDLARSFSGRYTRGRIGRGRQAWAVIGCGEEEDLSGADDILAYGILWLDWLRQRSAGEVIEGLKIFLPAGRAETTAARMAWLNSSVAKWELYETSSRETSDAGGEQLHCRDVADVGNLKTKLPSLPSSAPRHLQSDWVSRIAAMSPAIEVRTGPSGLLAWSINGLVFARQTPKGIVFGCGRAETALSEETEQELGRLAQRIAHHRRAHPVDISHPLYRVQPERWMESILSREVASLGSGFSGAEVYEQVPAVSGTVRGLLDMLTADSEGRLVVIELKASEDFQLPLQALDYWMRVYWHQQRGELEREGYFGGRSLSAKAPLLLLVSPALQFHAGCEVALRYLSPEVEVVRIGLNENWRAELKIVFRDRNPVVARAAPI